MADEFKFLSKTIDLAIIAKPSNFPRCAAMDVDEVRERVGSRLVSARSYWTVSWMSMPTE